MTLVTDDGGLPVDNEDIAEFCDLSDEPEFRRTVRLDCVEGRLGGKDGADCIVGVRLGSGGGARCWTSC